MLKNPNYVYGSSETTVPVNLNFGDYIIKRLLLEKNKTAITNATTQETLTFGDIAQQAMNLALSLTRIGVKRGDVVAIASENRMEFLCTVIGVACAGGVVTTINTRYTKDEMRHVTNISRPKFIFCSPLAYTNYEDTFKTMKYLRKIILFGDEKAANTLLYKELAIAGVNSAVSGLTRNISHEEFEVVDVDGQVDTLFILYSSGTTGLPKGVMITHLNVLSTLRSSYNPDIQVGITDANTVSLTVAPWYHALGLVGSLGTLSMGRQIVFMTSFDVNLYLATIEKYKIQELMAVPSLLVALCKMDSPHDVSSVTYILCGTAPLRKETLKDVKKRFPNVEVFQGYGMTECTLAITKDIGEVALTKPGGVGPAVNGITVKIVDVETGKVLGPKQSGEICVKGPMVTKGYIGKDRRDDFDDEGFFKTGDIGYYDEDRYFFIVDRLKELIKYKGFQVPPAEIEAVLLQHEGVRDVGVVGIEDKLGGEVPMAFVSVQPSKSPTVKELQDFVAERLSNPKHLRGGVRFIDEIPRNASGKILRRELWKMVGSLKSKL